MTNDNLNTGVGKKIVEALRQQSEIEIIPVPVDEFNEEDNAEETLFSDSLVDETEDELSTYQEEEVTFNDFDDDDDDEELFADDEIVDEVQDEPEVEEELPTLAKVEPEPVQAFEPKIETPFEFNVTSPAEPAVKVEPKQYSEPATVAPSISIESLLGKFATEESDKSLPEIPSNVAILKRLIEQLPSGVTRHTGAQIIRQTMEALGISMKTVLQEAQQVQELLSRSARECQANIQEHKKHISALEKQVQTYKKQYGTINELISLFISTNK